MPTCAKMRQPASGSSLSPDWEDFKRVINGDGPCNAERLAVRRAAEENGAWVRRALSAGKTERQYVRPLA